jgi:hypothetical protein
MLAGLVWKYGLVVVEPEAGVPVVLSCVPLGLA